MKGRTSPDQLPVLCHNSGFLRSLADAKSGLLRNSGVFYESPGPIEGLPLEKGLPRPSTLDDLRRAVANQGNSLVYSREAFLGRVEKAAARKIP